MRLNGFGAPVTAVQAALADEDRDSAPLFVSTEPGNSGLSSLVATPTYVGNGWLSHDRMVSVRIGTFDGCFRSSALPRIDLVKIDLYVPEARAIS